ncbi:cyclic pyranopterin monophosphate synthase MoaC [Flammeovirga yaeyamensis]|uniref:cyclic pyranopterin monophosphate synthase n=1 Tax=Flammeovirga yaeyamensis TaxID=367791 RepID=A0AAX1N7F5_9BACT|nr:cyclic pyranopterin monophosphate synthase MoaC [Flammeovirga yaeyamensis]MBB3698054.1 cyclic pyranopterin phosphate synthase [Flammeovirga yaeyamensis]NMF35594.1 cyclic pyranopterin monophosphate synthase MoaC [Flammeovirga yaeyamensis]QWG03448.1 cyclic pyranopterin monophosphate synthase MoaC [Flammeovirga yaeyamensis]
MKDQEEKNTTLTHLDKEGNPSMVDVGEKNITTRVAIAQSIVEFPLEVAQTIQKQDNLTKKGSIFQTAIIAGIMGTKKTSELIPLCHPLPLDKCNIEIEWTSKTSLLIKSTAKVTSKTGVEMEALTGATVAALTIYDMCKALSQDIIIKETKLYHKSGGKTDFNR